MTTVRRLAARVALVLAATVGIVTVTTGASSAYTYSTWGYPGATTTPRITAQVLDADTARITFPARTVYRSNAYAAYTQRICVTYDLVYSGTTYSTQWTDYASRPRCGWVNNAVPLTFPGWAEDVYTYFIWSGNVTISWYLSNGRLIGQTYQDYNQVGDYACYGGCWVASSYSLGAYILF